MRLFQIAVLKIGHDLLKLLAHEVIGAADRAVSPHGKAGKQGFVKAVVNNNLPVQLLKFLKRKHIAGGMLDADKFLVLEKIVCNLLSKRKTA